MYCNCDVSFNDIVKHLSQISDSEYRNSYGDFLDGHLYFSKRVQNPSFNKAANRIYRERMVKQNKDVYSDAKVFSDNNSSSFRSVFRKLPVPISRYKSYEKNPEDSEFLGYLDENEPCTDRPTFDEMKEIFSSVINPVPRNSKQKKLPKKMSRKIRNRVFRESLFKSRKTKLLSRDYRNGNITDITKNLTDMIRKAYFDRIKEKIYQASNYKLYEDLNLLDNDFKNQEVIIDSLKGQNSIDRKVNIKDQITFPMFYHSIGSIRLPIDDIEEPFEAWYAALFNMSRIDYYHGKEMLFMSFNKNSSRILDIHIYLSFSYIYLSSSCQEFHISRAPRF